MDAFRACRGVRAVPPERGRTRHPRAVALAPYKVTPEIMAVAKPKAIFMHDLPMHRGEEVEAAVADGAQSVIFDQAENRMHAHKALLMHLLC